MRSVIQATWLFGLFVVQTVATPLGKHQGVHDQAVLVDSTYINSPVKDLSQGDYPTSIDEEFGNDNVHTTVEVERLVGLNSLPVDAGISINVHMLEASKIVLD